MVSNDSNVMSAGDNLLSIRRRKWLIQRHGSWLTACYWSGFLLRALLVRCRSHRCGCRVTWTRNMPRCHEAYKWHPKKGEANDSVRRVVVVCGQQKQQTMGLARSWCWHAWNCGCLYWCSRRSCGPSTMEFLASSLSSMHGGLHRFLGSVCGSCTEQAASSGSQRDGQNELHWAIQQHLETTGISISAKNLVLFQILGKSHWRYLVFCASLQCIITCLALPLINSFKERFCIYLE